MLQASRGGPVEQAHRNPRGPQEQPAQKRVTCLQIAPPLLFYLLWSAGQLFSFCKIFQLHGLFSSSAATVTCTSRPHREVHVSPPPPPPPLGPIFLKEGERSCLGRRPRKEAIDACPSFAFSSRETRLESCVFEIITSISVVCVVWVYVFLALFDYCC